MTTEYSVTISPMESTELDKVDEKLYARKKCIRCMEFYTEAQNAQCFYHPGVWVEPTFDKGAQVGWSCCRNIGPLYKKSFYDVNPEAMVKNGKGCEQAELHEEDPSYSAIMSHFPFDMTEVAKHQEKEEQQPSLLEMDITTNVNDISSNNNNATKQAPSSPPSSPRTHDENVIEHTVTSSDTLVGLSLKYNASVQDIKRLNKLNDDRIFTRKVLLIPIGRLDKLPETEDDKNNRVIMSRTFKRKTGCDADETKYYLEEADFDLEKALLLWEEDQKWESQEGGEKKLGRVVRVESPKPQQAQPSVDGGLCLPIKKLIN